MSEVLENLFGSKARTRVLRFFLLNPDREYSVAETAKRNMLKISDARREINNFKKIKFVSEKIKKGKKRYHLNVNFAFYPELKNLIVKSNVYPQCESLGKIKNIGSVKLAIVSGIFLNHPKSKADMILAADNVSRRKLNNLINNIEAELGKEIKYVLMSGEELRYRVNMMDRFLLDFIKEPHNEIINKIPEIKRLKR